MIASAETGTGKTLAYAFPILQELYIHRQRFGQRNEVEPLALLLLPTKELAEQVFHTFSLCEKMINNEIYVDGKQAVSMGSEDGGGKQQPPMMRSEDGKQQPLIRSEDGKQQVPKASGDGEQQELKASEDGKQQVLKVPEDERQQVSIGSGDGKQETHKGSGDGKQIHKGSEGERKLTNNSKFVVRKRLIVGTMSRAKQEQQIQKGTDIIIGTSGRGTVTR